MKKLVAVGFISLCLFSYLVSRAVVRASPGRGDVAQTLISLDKEWTAAVLRNDKEGVGRILAEDYKDTTSQGVVRDKKQYLSEMGASTNRESADEYDIKIFGDVAVMTHRGVVTGERNFTFRSTHVWVKRAGRWLVTTSHNSRVAESSQ